MGKFNYHVNIANIAYQPSTTRTPPHYFYSKKMSTKQRPFSWSYCSLKVTEKCEHYGDFHPFSPHFNIQLSYHTSYKRVSHEILYKFAFLPNFLASIRSEKSVENGKNTCYCLIFELILTIAITFQGIKLSKLAVSIRQRQF